MKPGDTAPLRRRTDVPRAAGPGPAEAPAPGVAGPGCAALLAVVESVREAVLGAERAQADAIGACAPQSREGARNLVHYLAFRRRDLRPLQPALARLGLSSLGRAEAQVLASLESVARALRALDGQAPDGVAPDPRFEAAAAGLARATLAAFGTEPPGRRTRVMVTLPTEAADDPSLLVDLLDAGTDLVRINAAHDDAGTWTRMVERLDVARMRTARPCRIAFDLGGPKLRTGPIEPGHAVLRLKPRRDELGRVLAAASVRLVPSDASSLPVDGATLPVAPALLHRIRLGDAFDFVDARGRRRRLSVTGFAADGAPVCTTERTAYLVPGTVLTRRRPKGADREGEVGPMPARAGSITLAPGDRLDLVHGDGPGRERRIDLAGDTATPAAVPCGVAEVFACLRPGDRVLFDDGRIETVAREVAAGRATLEVVRCAGGAARLRAGKGINLPDTVLALPSMTARDREDLAFAVGCADLVSASFVQRPEDVDALRDALAALGAPATGIVLKIETAVAFSRLPELLLAALRHAGPVAVMVARGDLAVEIGFERLAEVQEEILWLCEAAHVPVIWATEVLATLARDGMPSRAEVTDAAMSGRAECVMLNKGPYVVGTVRFLCDVLARMRGHQDKKSSMLRALAVSGAEPVGPAPRPSSRSA